jgi:3D (Asp-Asp-Asp) domain-containing protein
MSRPRLRPNSRLGSGALLTLATATATICCVMSTGVAAASGAGAGLTGGGTVAASPAASPAASGGASLGPAPTPSSRRRTHKRAAKTPSKKARGAWYHGVTITEYWAAPESWFVGTLVSAPGLTGLHRIDWLYSATGVSMEGEGIGLDGQMYHIDALGTGGWVTADAKPTAAVAGFTGGAPYWRAGAYWVTTQNAVTFPLAAGGWSNGSGRRYVALPGVTFAAGPSLPLRYYQSIAVDPNVIPIGSRVYIPAYRHDGHGGWFVAQDTGGAIIGRHVDVYRPPPDASTTSGLDLSGQKVYVVRARS